MSRPDRSDASREGALLATVPAETVAPRQPPGASSDADAGWAAASMSTSGQRQYGLGAQIAVGGMGRILAAHDRRLDRPVAIKELLVPSAAHRSRFEREVRITARLQHPGIVGVIDAGQWPSGEPFFAMKLVAGDSLDQVIARATTLAERLALLPHALAVVDALAYAHAQGVIHRDLKPHNVLVGAFGETVVIDWGLAKDLAEVGPDFEAGPDRTGLSASSETVAGAVLGTPSYMPPEQALGQPVDERADVYALGAILYHVLAGKPPVAGKSAEEVLDRVVAGPPVPLATQQPGLPPDLLTIVGKAMAYDASQRYASARELAEDLKRFQTGQLVGAHSYSSVQLLARWLRRHRAAVAVAAVMLTMLVGLSALAARRILRERDMARNAQLLAEARRTGAEGMIDRILTSLKPRLDAVGRIDALKDVGDMVSAYYDSTRDADAHAKALAQRSNALAVLGFVENRLNDGAESLRLYRLALTLAEQALTTEPASLEWAALVARQHGEVGGALAGMGARPEATRELETAIALADAVLLRSPEHPDALDNKARASGWLCYAELGSGSVKRAGTMCDRALAIREGQVAREPGDAMHQSDLMWAYSRRAWVSYEEMKYAEVEGLAQKGIEIGEALLVRAPHDNQVVFRLASCFNFLGLSRQSRQHNDGARAAFERARVLFAKLVELEPSNQMWQERLAAMHAALAQIELYRGDLDGALIRANTGLQIMTAVRAAGHASKSNAYVYLEVVRSLGDVYLERGQAELAASSVDAGLLAAEEIMAAHSGIGAFVGPLHGRAATARLRLGQPEAAVAHLERNIELNRADAAQLKDLPGPAVRVCLALIEYFELQLARGHLEDAETLAREAQAVAADAMRTAPPDFADTPRMLALSHHMLARVAHARSDTTTERTELRATVAAYAPVTRLCPELPDTWTDLADAAAALVELEAPGPERLAALRQLIDALEQLALLEPLPQPALVPALAQRAVAQLERESRAGRLAANDLPLVEAARRLQATFAARPTSRLHREPGRPI